MARYEHLHKKAGSAEEGFGRLIEILKLLRSPGGCDWDRVQTHKSIRNCLIEEAYETVEAIDNEDFENLCEELGDVLLQVVFHGNMAEEEGKFSILDIENGVCDKMIRRHPHVFFDQYIESIEQSIDKLAEKWENIKREEHKGETLTENIRKVPNALPALIKSYKVQKKAARVGFDWDSVSGALDKLAEEERELMGAMYDGNKEHMKEELGDLLFTVVNIARFLDLDPEEALNGATEKFIKRLEYIEKYGTMEGKTFEEMSPEQMDRLWKRAKDEL